MLEGPSARTCSFLKKALTLNTEPVRRWHSPQWQTPTTSGSADTSTRKAPQEQCAVLVIVPLLIQAQRDYRRAALRATAYVARGRPCRGWSILGGRPSQGCIDSSQIESLGGGKADVSNAPTATPQTAALRSPSQ